MQHQSGLGRPGHVGNYGRQSAGDTVMAAIKQGEKMNISKMTKYLTGGITLVLIFSACLAAQMQEESARSSVGINIGYFLPQGSWTEARTDPSVDYFKKGLYFEGDLELAVFQWWTIVVSGGFTVLDVSEWEEHVASTGDTLSGSAGMFHMAISVRPYLMSGSAFNVKAQLGLGYFFLSGEETYNSIKYDYDFLKSGIGLIAGIEVDQYLSSNAAIAIRFSYFVIPSGVEYADQSESHNVTGMPITIGIRFDF